MLTCDQLEHCSSQVGRVPKVADALLKHCRRHDYILLVNTLKQSGRVRYLGGLPILLHCACLVEQRVLLPSCNKSSLPERAQA